MLDHFDQQKKDKYFERLLANMSNRRKKIKRLGHIWAKGGQILKDYLGKYEQKEDKYQKFMGKYKQKKDKY